MNWISAIQLFISSGLAVGFVVIIFRAGRLVESINNLDLRLTQVEKKLQKLSDDLRGFHLELKDVQTKITALWDQREIL